MDYSELRECVGDTADSVAKQVPGVEIRCKWSCKSGHILSARGSILYSCRSEISWYAVGSLQAVYVMKLQR